MPTPVKPYEVIKSEKRSHRTKAELENKRKNEAAVLSGISLKEKESTLKNPIAHKEFLRIKKLLNSIKKSDDIYGSVINRYCILSSELDNLEKKREEFSERLNKLEELYDKMNNPDRYINYSDFLHTTARIQGTILAVDKQVQAKRKMMLDIEKENVMTIASALRSIPKAESEEEDPVLRVLRKRRQE